jgi:hypothetical protein
MTLTMPYVLTPFARSESFLWAGFGANDFLVLVMTVSPQVAVAGVAHRPATAQVRVRKDTVGRIELKFSQFTDGADRADGEAVHTEEKPVGLPMTASTSSASRPAIAPGAQRLPSPATLARLARPLPGAFLLYCLG